MLTRTVLIVDDSRVALHALRRLLEEHRLQVDTAESGEDALKYLRQNMPPAVIFMDHMMPGMDGFEALEAIKRDAATAPIPVVMYTSKEGESYSGHAKALGAADVLFKPIKPLQLVKILQKLSLTNDNAVERDDSVYIDDRVDTATRPAQPAPPPSNTYTTLKRLFDEQRVQLRDDMHAVLGQSSRANDKTRWIGIAVLAAAGIAIFAASSWMRYRDSERRSDRLSAEVATLKAQEANAAVPGPERAATLETQLRQALHDKSVLIDTLAWSLRNNGDYDYDQVPLNDDRLYLIRELVTRLSQANIKGTLRIETHVGEFCLTRTEAGTWRMPSDDAPIARCEFVTYSPEQAVNLGKRQSIAFARFLSGTMLANSGIRIEIVSFGKEHPLIRYPQTNTLETAGEWNKIARRNNRIEVAIVPAP